MKELKRQARMPTPSDPYPLNAAGWGPEVGNGLLFSDCHAVSARQRDACGSVRAD
jgi:hypothetical protein